MTILKKTLAVGAGVAVAVGASAFGQNPAPAPASSAQATLQVPGSLDWHEQSDLSAKREGVINSIEFQVGMHVEKDMEVGRLYDEIAQLTVTKQKIIAESVGQTTEAKAKKQLASANLARLLMLQRMREGYVSKEEVDKAVAEVNVADALIISAEEKSKVDNAEYRLAEQALADHSIRAPFAGIVIERYKNPGEAVRANEPVVRLGKTDRFRFVAWVPLEAAQRIHANDVVEFHPEVEGANLPIEQQVFTGKISSISREVSTVHHTEARVLAEIDNPPNPDHPENELFQGMTGFVVIKLSGQQPARVGVANQKPSPKAR
jgi:RND family efflux transporter MFP subunit